MPLGFWKTVRKHVYKNKEKVGNSRSECSLVFCVKRFNIRVYQGYIQGGIKKARGG